MNYPDTALEILKHRGYRVTRPRRLVLEALEIADVPLSAYELAERIKERGERGDVVSIYRILQALEENDLVHRVLSSGKYSKCHLQLEADCDRPQLQHCHHNLVCRQCGRIEEFHCPGLELIEQFVATQSHYQIESHVLEFKGLCGACLKGA